MDTVWEKVVSLQPEYLLLNDRNYEYRKEYLGLQEKTFILLHHGDRGINCFISDLSAKGLATAGVRPSTESTYQ
jgi:hypothetical protein